MASSEPVFVGMRVKTARAIVVAVRGRRKFEILDRRTLSLADPREPDSAQPFHVGLETPGKAGERAVERACRAVRKATARALHDWVKELTQAGTRPAGAGIVGSSANPDRIGNPHVRAHASEGKLFREAVEEGIEALELAFVSLPEKEAWDQGSLVVRIPPAELNKRLTELGQAVGPPWRMDEKLAALAGWVAAIER